MHPRLTDMRAADDRAGQLTFLRAPIGGIEHLRRGAKPAERIQQFIAAIAVFRQPLTGQRHAQLIALRPRHIDRAAPDLIRDTALIQRPDDIACRAAFQPGIKQGHRGRANQPRHPENPQKHQCNRTGNDDLFTPVQISPDSSDLLHDHLRLADILPGASLVWTIALNNRLVPAGL